MKRPGVGRRSEEPTTRGVVRVLVLVTTCLEMGNVNGLTLFLAFNINNITTTGLSNNNSLTLRAVHLTLTEIGAVSA